MGVLGVVLVYKSGLRFLAILLIFVIFPLKFPLKSKKTTTMGRKGPRAKTKIVLKSVSKVDQLGSMHNLKFQTFLNKNPPNGHYDWFQV